MTSSCCIFLINQLLFFISALRNYIELVYLVLIRYCYMLRLSISATLDYSTSIRSLPLTIQRVQSKTSKESYSEDLCQGTTTYISLYALLGTALANTNCLRSSTTFYYILSNCIALLCCILKRNTGLYL
jgi:hypothetical protein